MYYFQNLVFKVCSQGWTKIVFYNPYGRASDYRMQGACYWSHLNYNEFTKLKPLLNNKGRFTHRFKKKYIRHIFVGPNTEEGDAYKRSRKNVAAIYNYGQGQAGFSVHMPKVRMI